MCKFTESEIQIISRRFSGLRQHYNVSIVNRIEALINVLRLQKWLSNEQADELYTLLSSFISHSQEMDDVNINSVSSTNSTDWDDYFDEGSLTKEKTNATSHIRESLERTPPGIAMLLLFVRNVINKHEKAICQTRL